MLKVSRVRPPTGFLAEGRKAPCKQSKLLPSPVKYFWTMMELEACGDRHGSDLQSDSNYKLPQGSATGG